MIRSWIFILTLFFTAQAWAIDKVKLSLDWVPQGEHGGFFQAIAQGYYADQGIELEIVPGGPSVNTKAMLMADQVEFNIGGSAGALNYALQDLPFSVVAAYFQKTPQILMSHPNVGIDHPSDFVGKTIFLSNFGRLSFWAFIKNKYNLSDDQLKSYNFNSQPFIEDPQSIQQGYLSSEPFAIKKAAGFEPVVHLYKSQIYQIAENLELPEEIINQDASPDVWSFTTNDEEFFYAVPYSVVDLILFSRENGLSTAEILKHSKLSSEKIEKLIQFQNQKENKSRHMRENPHTIK